MKLIKAFIREEQVSAIVGALEKTAAPGFTVSKAFGLGGHHATAVNRGVPYAALRPICVLEVLASEDRADEIVGVLLHNGRTGFAGDGHVMVMAVEDAYAVKSGWREVA